VGIFGEGFFAVRLLSNLAVVGTIVLLGLFVFKETNKKSASMIAIGLYLASFRFTGSWMDLGKTDSLFLFWAFLGFYLQSVDKKHSPSWLLMAIAYTLAYFTKQLALPLIIVTAGVSLVFSRFSSWKEWLLTAILGFGGFFVWDVVTQGWFSFYTFDTTIHHTINQAMLLNFWLKILPTWWPSLFIIVIFVSYRLWKAYKKETAINSLVIIGGFWLGLLAASWSVFLKVWTYDNDLMPIALGSALIGGLGYGELNRWYVERNEKKQTILFIVFIAFVIAQFSLWRYKPLDQIPSQQDLVLGQRFVAQLEALDGDIWVFNHGFYTALAGKQTFLHSSPLGDIAGIEFPEDLPTDTAERRDQTLEMVKNARDNQQFSWVFVDKNPESWLPYYIPAMNFFEREDGFYPVTGAATRPDYGLYRNPIVYGGGFPLTSAFMNNFFSDNWIMAENGRRLRGSEGDIDVVLRPDAQYALDILIAPYCESDTPFFSKVSWYFNETFLTEIQVANCQEILTEDVIVPADAITGEMDTITVGIHNSEMQLSGFEWVFELRELSFHLLSSGNLPE
jgi:hypothetical protein